MNKLNLGCGKDIKAGYVNLDCIQLSGVDVVCDLEQFPYPFANEYFDVVEAHQVLEHINHLPELMNEIARILKKGGQFIIDVPHFTSNTSYMDPTHRRLFAYTTFDFFVKKHFDDVSYDYQFAQYGSISKQLRFYKGFYVYNYLIEPVVNLLLKVGNGHLYEANMLRNFFPAWRLEVILKKN